MVTISQRKIIGAILGYTYYSHKGATFIYEGYIPKWEPGEELISVDQLRNRGFSCRTCKFYNPVCEKCVCSPRKVLQECKGRGEKKVFKKNDFDKQAYLPCDERKCCEFYYSYMFDVKSRVGPMMLGEYVTLRREHLSDYIKALEIWIDCGKTLEDYDNHWAYMYEKLEKEVKKLREYKKVLDFFKNDCSSLYRAVMKEYKRAGELKKVKRAYHA